MFCFQDLFFHRITTTEFNYWANAHHKHHTSSILAITKTSIILTLCTWTYPQRDNLPHTREKLKHNTHSDMIIWSRECFKNEHKQLNTKSLSTHQGTTCAVSSRGSPAQWGCCERSSDFGVAFQETLSMHKETVGSSPGARDYRL